MNLYEMLDSYHIPYVFIQGVHAQLLDRPQILLDDCRGAYLATRYLIELGHRRIVGVFKSDDTQGQQRHKGYVQALRKAGIAYDPDKMIWFYTEDARPIRLSGSGRWRKIAAIIRLRRWWRTTIRLPSR